MRRLAGLVGAAGLLAGATVACGPEVQEQEGRVVGFAYGIDSKILQDDWVQHTGESSMPWGGQIRNKRHYTDFTGCEEVDNSVQPEDVYEEPSVDTYDGWYEDESADDEWDYDIEYGFGGLSWDYDESDDLECRDDFWCNSDDYSHCEAVYEDRYDYQQLVTTTIQSCPAPVEITIDKPRQPAINAQCIGGISELQRIEQTAWYIVSVTVRNPFYDDETNPREVLRTTLRLSPEAWESLDQGDTIALEVAENQTVQLK
ncbi:MAG: hypothetical protein KIH63_000920 [Candidatus Saccharibacteria bacterium]|nr:hypothetical protein [Candidatus Saccharibacteria bacterium]